MKKSVQGVCQFLVPQGETIPGHERERVTPKGHRRFLASPVAVDGVHERTLKRALEIVVTRERLAAELDLALPELDAYLAGERPLTNEKFIAALDIVAKRKSE